ncbi:MAG: hypothetical protein RLY14_655 [Planctomycetota bacterium]
MSYSSLAKAKLPALGASQLFPGTDSRRTVQQRSGTVLVLMAVLMTALALTVAISIDIAYIHVSKMELRAATDAAARAASATLASTQDSALATKRGQEVARMNKVGGVPLALQDANFSYGNSSRDKKGLFVFAPGKTPYNAVKVNADLGNGLMAGAIKPFFKKIHGVSDIAAKQEAIATFLERDIVLVVDRSGSMSGKPYQDLCDAVQIFLETLEESEAKEFVGLASYASTSSIDCGFTQNLDTINTKVRSLIISGGTNIGAGISSGHDIVKTGRSKLVVDRTIVVMTDGIHNVGVNPITAATSVAKDGVTIHAITFGAGADKSLMQRVAQIGGGRYLHADTGTELKKAFKEIALSLTTILTY